MWLNVEIKINIYYQKLHLKYNLFGEEQNINNF